jgi:hypothetical protein
MLNYAFVAIFNNYFLNVLVSFCYCDKIPEKNQSNQAKDLFFAHSFRSCSPTAWFCHFRPVVAQEVKERERSWGPNIQFKGITTMI